MSRYKLDFSIECSLVFQEYLPFGETLQYFPSMIETPESTPVTSKKSRRLNSSNSSVLSIIDNKSGQTINMYICKLCDKRYTDKTSLCRHMRTVHGSPFEELRRCSFPGCTYTCARADHLKNHQKIHVSKKELVCKYSWCTFKTKRPYNMDIHCANVHDS
mgnify:CR=1 FL=1